MTKVEQAVTNAYVECVRHMGKKFLIREVLCTSDSTPYYLRIVADKDGDAKEVQVINENHIDARLNAWYDDNSLIEAIVKLIH